MSQYLRTIASSGHGATTPDTAGNSITGDIDVRVRVRADFTPGSTDFLFAKYRASTGNRSWRFVITAGNNLEFRWSVDGSATLVESVTPSLTDHQVYWLRATLDVDDGASNYELKFWTADGQLINPSAGDFSQLGATDSGAATTSIHDSGTKMTIGSNGSPTPGENFAGDFYRAQLYNGIDGSLILDFEADDFTFGDSDTDTAVASTGETWTLTGASTDIQADPAPGLVSQLLTAVEPAISIDITPSLVSQLLAGVEPVVEISAAQDIAPSLASQLLTATDPTVTPGLVDVSPSLVSQLFAGVDPQLDLNVAPALVSQLVAGVDPALSIDVTPSLVSQLFAAVDPQLDLDLTPSAVSQLLTAIDPTITPGSVDITITLVSQLIAGVDPTLTLSAQDIALQIVIQLVVGNDPAVGGGEHSLAPGFDIARFYRRNISGSEQLFLVVGLPRSVGKGFRADESWDTVSGHFALPAEPRHPAAKKEAIGQVITAWEANKTDTQAVVTSAINAALITAGYTRPHGVAIT